MTTTVMWFRRDLRLGDNPALHAALDAGDDVLALFVVDPRIANRDIPRTRRLFASLAQLNHDMESHLIVREGDPRKLVPKIAKEVGATQVFAAAESTPFGRLRDHKVQAELEAKGIEFVRTGSSYAVGPGSVFTGSDTPYKVFTPFSRGWRDLGWREPAPKAKNPSWFTGSVSGKAFELPRRQGEVNDAGERAALAQWKEFLDDGLATYDKDRDRPDRDATSRMSIRLKYGEVHPRTLLADIAEHPDGQKSDAQRYVTELCWREFYADVLWHNPDSAWHDLNSQLADISYDEGTETDELVEAWKQGKTGFPIVDAGMRQLLAEGWMHNRLRMITASFLTKDLHVWWPVGAQHFLDHLLDGDVASNNHGWQWTAGTGTDASPYFRVFNPITQGLKFDPQGEYVRRWVPELAHLEGKAAHEPWKTEDGYKEGYPRQIVDHGEARKEALERYDQARKR